MFYLCVLYLFTYTGVQHDFHVRWCWCHLAVTRRVTIVEQELLTLPEHLGFALFICLSGVPCCSMLSNFMFSFPRCDVRYEFRVKRCSVPLYYYLFCRRFTFYLWFLYLLTHTGVQQDFPVRWRWCHLTGTRRVAIGEQELLTLPEHLRSLRFLCGVRVARSLDFCVVFCRSLFVHLSLFDLRILITAFVS
jgi:hypothetical protein